jgi:hypothetical protein
MLIPRDRTRYNRNLSPSPNAISRFSRTLPHLKRILLHALGQLLLCEGDLGVVVFYTTTVELCPRSPLVALPVALLTTI